MSARLGLVATMAVGGLALYALARREPAGLGLDYTQPAFGAGGDPGDDAEPLATRAGRSVGDVLNAIRDMFGAGRALSPQALDPAFVLQLALERTVDAPWPDASVVMGIVEQESNFRPDALGGAGEIGLMQILPSTAAQFSVTDPNALYDPRVNIDTGVALLRWLRSYGQQRTGTDPSLDMILASYNAGVGNVYSRGFIPTSYVNSTLRRIARWQGAVG